jgi:tetratricopeptide (TPR) repeat protein
VAPHSIIILRAMRLESEGALDEALALLDEAEGMCRQTGDLRSLRTALEVRHSIFQRQEDLFNILATFEEREHVCRILGDIDELTSLLAEHAVWLKVAGQAEAARALLKEHEALSRQGGDPQTIERSLRLQAELRDVGASPGALCMEANQLADAGRYDEALARFEQALDLNPEYGPGWSDMGICLLSMNRFADAEQALREATRFLPDDVKTWAPLGAALAYQRKVPEALECLDLCLKLAPTGDGTRMLADHLRQVVSADAAAARKGGNPDAARELETLVNWIDEQFQSKR